jgi:hypothetical protein
LPLADAYLVGKHVRTQYLLRDRQRELSDSARSAGIAFTVDSEGFLVVASDDDVRRVSSITSAIDRRILHAYWCYSAESFEKFRAERDINIARQVPLIEYETISDRLARLRRANPPAILRHYCLAIRNESSLPKGSRPWDRE